MCAFLKAKYRKPFLVAFLLQIPGVTLAEVTSGKALTSEVCWLSCDQQWPHSPLTQKIQFKKRPQWISEAEGGAEPSQCCVNLLRLDIPACAIV